MNSSKTINLLAECGETSAALEAEHAAIQSALEALGDAMLAGAPLETLANHMGSVIDFCVTHFEDEEEFLRRNGDDELHASAHNEMLSGFRAVRNSIRGDGSREHSTPPIC